MSSREGSPEIVDDKFPDVVDPLIRAHIYSLCTALGGASTTEVGGRYTLGDDALAVLKDLRRWLKLYDEKLNRYDVARCLSEINLIKGDLLEILATWKDSDTMNKSKHRIMLACIELLTPLTWPLEKDDEQMTRNYHRHMPVLQYAQQGYKKAILQHRSNKMLKDIIRVALPSIAVPVDERGDRDEGIIKLVLYAIRNIAIIEHPNPTDMDPGEDIGRSATINAFADQNVFDLLLTISSGIGDEFKFQDGVMLEILYHIVKGIDVESIFRNEKQENEKKSNDISQLLKQENEANRKNVRTATRHNRFGTTVWIEKEDGARLFVPGQQALLGKNAGLEKMDQTKKYNKPRGADKKGVSRKSDFDMNIIVDNAARQKLRDFVENFIDSGFNPLFHSIRRGLERDVDRLMDTAAKQYFTVVAWFLKAERVRRNATKQADRENGVSAAEDSFGVVAAALEQEFLITLSKRMMEWFDMKSWKELQAGMRCFTQIMYTVQDMTQSPIEDDQEIAENIQNRLFYEETTMILILDILKAYTRQPFKWLDDCTEMVHVHLRLLEKYATQHEHMFIRSRKRQTKKRKQKAIEDGEQEQGGEENDEELAAASKRAVADRAFDFQKFEARFLQTKCIDTFVAFLEFYKELNAEQIMRAIKFFHRIFEKRKEEVLLYRVDIVDLFYRMMQGSENLSRHNLAYKQVDQFARYYLKKLFRNLEKEPALYVEILFTKMNSTLYRLQHGRDKDVRVAQPRAAAELKIKDGMDQDGQVGVVVSVLLNNDKSEHVEWLKDVFKKAMIERRSWEDEAEARRLLEEESRDPDAPEPPPAEKPVPPIITLDPQTDERKLAMYKDGKFRLLLKTLGCEKADANETAYTKWIIPSNITAREIQDSLRLLQKHADSPPVYDEGVQPDDFIKRVTAPRPPRKRDGGMSTDSEGGDTDVEALFPQNHPEKSGSKPKKRTLGTKRRRRNDEVPDDILEERRLAKAQKEKEKITKIKSALYIVDSDDNSEDDATFFERERQIRERGPTMVDQPNMKATGTRKRKRQKVAKVVNDDSDSDRRSGTPAVSAPETTDDEGHDDEGDISMRTEAVNIQDSDDDAPVPTRTKSNPIDLEDDEDEKEAPIFHSSARGQPKTVVLDDEDEEEDEDVPIARPKARKRAPVVMSSDSE
ncbi:timeless protein-domain-containing protein [Geopyxis carbonaria]|nr:timeless protein-domain-containing protein [Geopyxis carbonaria]